MAAVGFVAYQYDDIAIVTAPATRVTQRFYQSGDLTGLAFDPHNHVAYVSNLTREQVTAIRVPPAS